MSELKQKSLLQERRKRRVRFKLKSNNGEKLKRICFVVSNRYLYAQLVDDASNKTIFGVSTHTLKSGKDDTKAYSNKDCATKMADAFFTKLSSVLSNSDEKIYF